MVSIALVSGRLVGAAANVAADDMLTEKGHTVTFFDQSAVTAVNLAAFALIYVNVPDVADSTFEGHIRGYMRTDNIPVIVAGFDGSGVATDSLTSALGIAQEVEGVVDPNAAATDAVLPTGYEDLQVVSGLDTDFPIVLRDDDDEGWFVPFGKKHKGTPLLLDANDNVIMFQADSTDTDFTDTTQTLGARFVFVGWSGDDDYGREGAALIEAAIEWATLTATFSFPTSGARFTILRPIDLDRLVNYEDSTVSWVEVTPGSTTVTVEDCQDELVTFNGVTSGGEINGFVTNDPITGFVFLRVTLVTTLATDTPELNTLELDLEGQSPSLRQLGAPTAPDHDPTVLAEDNWYKAGLVTWLTGANEGLNMEVRKWVNSTRQIELFLPMPFTIAAGDIFQVYTGCQKRRQDCRDKFDNIVNYRGEPFVPGSDHLFRTPNAPQG
jgi:hypothetical protein